MQTHSENLRTDGEMEQVCLHRRKLSLRHSSDPQRSCRFTTWCLPIVFAATLATQTSEAVDDAQSFSPIFVKDASGNFRSLSWTYRINGGQPISTEMDGMILTMKCADLVLSINPAARTRQAQFSATIAGDVRGSATVKAVEALEEVQDEVAVQSQSFDMSMKLTVEGISMSFAVDLLSVFTPSPSWFLDRPDLDQLGAGFTWDDNAWADTIGTAKFSIPGIISETVPIATSVEIPDQWTIVEILDRLVLNGRVYHNVVVVDRLTQVPTGDTAGSLEETVIRYWVAKGIGMVKGTGQYRLLGEPLDIELVGGTLPLPTNAAPGVVTPSSLPTGTDQIEYSQVLTASGGAAPYVWSLASGSLPSGLSLESDGTLQGVPSGVGTSSFTARVTGDNDQSATRLFRLRIDPLPEIAVSSPGGGVLLDGSSTLDFGPVDAGFASPLKTLLVQNVGAGDLVISGIAKTGANADSFVVSHQSMPVRIRPGGSSTIRAGFAPTVTGEASATLEIASNDLDENPFELPLTGTGTAPDFQFAVSQGIDQADLPPDIAGPFETVLSVAGLPSGLKYDPKTGKLTGTPAKAGAYTVKVRVRNLVDGTIRSVDMTIYVEALPAWAVGTFTSLISPPAPADQTLTGLGGYLRLTSSVSGTCTGSLILGAKKLSFKGQIEGVPEAERSEESLSSAVTIVPNSKDRTQDITLDLDFRPEDAAGDPGLTGTLTFLGAEMSIGPGWQHLWSSKTNPAFGNKDRVLNVALDNTEDTEGPQGDSLAILKLTKAGLATWSGTLADGRKVTGSFTASPDGDLPFYAAIPYPGGGALIALLGTEPVGELLGVVDEDDPNGRWIKRAPLVLPKALDRSYAQGFDLDLDIDGAQFIAPPRGQLLFGATAAPVNLNLALRGGGIEFSGQLPDGDPVILAAELQAGNKLVITPQNLPVKLAPGFSATNGSLSLSAKLSDLGPGTTKPVARTLTCTGLYIPDLLTPQDSAIRGFFQLPELPVGTQSAAATSLLSGECEIRPAR